MMGANLDGSSGRALRFVLFLGVVSLFADMTYEGARSIVGPYLATLGAGAVIVAAVSGFGELIGYGMRIVSGLLSDRTQRYWAVTIAGYSVNLLAVPALALTGHWEWAGLLIVTERFGKGVRTPARDAMLSHASQRLGSGWVFGLHEALDQIGAIIGPLIVTAVLAWNGSYRLSFAVLIVPAGLALTVLAVARRTYPHPQALEDRPHDDARSLSAAFKIYLAAAGCIALGFVDFPLAAYHMKAAGIVPDTWIPMIYAVAMAVDALSALILGRLYDRKGLPVLLIAVALGGFSAPLIFLGGPISLVAGMALWGVGMGTQESVLRAVVSDLVPSSRRATGFGYFNGGFGIAWFLGSSTMGLLYSRSLLALAAFSAVAHLASLPLLTLAHRRTG